VFSKKGIGTAPAFGDPTIRRAWAAAWPAMASAVTAAVKVMSLRMGFPLLGPSLAGLCGD